ncbi:hypothetical protein IW15_21450 [Chryseobacterium soli]|uniref:Uncharacterized protein n=1 Tax=Chryseobacterium soli TaxID=445961 RepID=A0A086A093_9FLAO|nr:hypothetical protein [Chryseobacterium soli]KFF10107.1 hypothetical protein IW15_21450 [Chryseobacterium soli]
MNANDFYPFGLEFGGSGMDIFNSISPSYTYTFQGQEKQADLGWNSYKWRNYDPTMDGFLMWIL